MTKAELNRLKYRTISFKNYLTGGWALKFQACVVNNYNSFLFLLVDQHEQSDGGSRCGASQIPRFNFGHNSLNKFLKRRIKYDSIKSY